MNKIKLPKELTDAWGLPEITIEENTEMEKTKTPLTITVMGEKYAPVKEDNEKLSEAKLYFIFAWNEGQQQGGIADCIGSRVDLKVAIADARHYPRWQVAKLRAHMLEMVATSETDETWGGK